MSVFQLIVRGCSTCEIAFAPGISFKNAETHREDIKVRLDLSNSEALVQRAISWVNHRGQGTAVALPASFEASWARGLFAGVSPTAIALWLRLCLFCRACL